MPTARFTCVTILTFLCTCMAGAQEPPNSGRRAERGTAATDAVKPGDLVNALDRYATVQARKILQLNDEQYRGFLPHFRALQQTRRRNHQARNRIVQELRRLAGPRATELADDATIARQLTALREQEDRAARELRAAYDAIDGVLDARQRARFRIFEETIEARKLDLLMRARGRRGGSGGQ